MAIEEPQASPRDPLALSNKRTLPGRGSQPSPVSRTTWMAVAGGGTIAALLLIGGLLWLTGDSAAPGRSSAAVTTPPSPDRPAAGLSAKTPTLPSSPSLPAALDPVRTDSQPPAAPANKPPSDGEQSGESAVVPALEQGLKAWFSSPADQLRGATPAGNQRSVVAQYSWMTFLLPHLGYADIFHQLRFEQPWTEGENLTVAATSIPDFLDPGNEQVRWRGYPFSGLPLTHFVGMAGLEGRGQVAAELPRSDPRAGVFGYDAVARPEDITDGAAHTIMLLGAGELLGPWIAGGGATVRGAHAPYFDPLTGFGTKSTTPGTMALFADGSTRFVPADVDPDVFQAWCTIHGNEPPRANELEEARPYFPTQRNP
jgi:hypothetical protein